jgi:hypothetical protein
MRRYLWLPLGAAIFAAVGVGAPAARDPGQRMASAAAGFLDSLRPDLRGRAAMTFEDPGRRDWHFVPRERPGVNLRDMNDDERRAAHALLRSALSSRGYLKVAGIMDLDAVLRDIARAAGQDGSVRDPGWYTFAVFGTPGAEGEWGWRVEGHHVSLNFTVGAAGVAVTPSFLGAHPAEVRAGPHAGLRVLAAEEDLARELLASLDSSQRARAVIAAEAPRDILMSPGRGRDALGGDAGLPASEMTETQRSILSRLVEEYAGNLGHELSGAQRARLLEGGVEALSFAWAGPDQRGRPHYYRIAGGRFVIEYDNTQDGANHVHTVWRDFENDFGDLLRAHLERDHGGR